MFKFGEIADITIVDKIAGDLDKQGIVVVTNDVDGKYYELFVQEEDQLPQAIDVLRVYLGLRKPPEVSKEWLKIKSIPMKPWTKGMILSCILVYVLINFLGYPFIKDYLFITNNEFIILSEVKNGQLWRLVTPMFLHFGLLHIFFNLMWLKDLGNIIEHKEGVSFYLIFILLISLFSNLGQYFISGHRFGGMSGVIFGLLGFLWMANSFNKDYEYKLPKSDVVTMVFWFFLCLSGILSIPIANMAHAIGLSLGMLIGIVKYAKSVDYLAFKFSFFAIFISVLTYYMDTMRGSLI